MRVFYPPIGDRVSAASKVVAPEDFVQARSSVCVDSQGLTVSPAYAVGWDADRRLYLGAAFYGADQNADCYGDVALPAVDGVEWLALVTDVVRSGRWRREVWELEYDDAGGCYRAARVYAAPVILRFVDESGRAVLSLPLGIPLVVVGIIALVTTVAGAVAYKFFEWRAEDARREAVEYIARVCEDRPEACHAILAGVAGDDAVHRSDGFLDRLRDMLLAGGAVLTAVIALLKLRILLEFVRGLFRFERR